MYLVDAIGLERVQIPVGLSNDILRKLVHAGDEQAFYAAVSQVPADYKTQLVRRIDAHCHSPAAARFLGEFKKQAMEGLSQRQLLVQLEGRQRDVVAAELDGRPLIVQGVAGSGKTAIAVQRLKERASQDRAFDSEYLLLMHNRSLFQACKELLSEVYADAPDEKITVRTVAAWWGDLLARCGVEYEFVRRMSNWRLERAFEQAWDSMRSGMRAQIEARGGWSSVVDSLKEKFGQKASGRWKSEFGDVMSSACMGDTQRYMYFDRSARQHDLSTVERCALAQIYRTYFAHMERQGKTMFFRLPLLVLELLESGRLDKCPGYREIVVDEAQELSKVDLYVISRIAKKAGADLVLLGDEDQATFADFSWDELELAGDEPERVNLFNSYRTPASIIEQAENMLQHPLPKAQPARRDGGHLSLVLCNEEEWTLTALVDRVRELLGAGVPANQIAVVVPDRKRMLDCEEALSRHWQVDVYRDEEGRATGLRLEEESIKLISYQSCGGFEFDHVIAMRVERGWFPGTKQRYHAGVNFDAWCRRKRRHLHVAMTRARKSLSMICRRQYKSFFLDDLDMGTVDLITYTRE